MENEDKYSKLEERAIQLSKSDLFATTNVKNLTVRMLVGEVFGLEPMQSLLGIDILTLYDPVTKQRTSSLFVKPKFYGARIKASGKYNYKVIEMTEQSCKIEFFERLDATWESIGVVDYTMEEALKSGIAKTKEGNIKTNYARNPKEMLFYRCLSRGVSTLCPDVIFGLPLYVEGVEEWGERVSKAPPSATEVNFQIVANNIKAEPEATLQVEQVEHEEQVEQAEQIEQVKQVEPFEGIEEIEEIEEIEATQEITELKKEKKAEKIEQKEEAKKAPAQKPQMKEYLLLKEWAFYDVERQQGDNALVNEIIIDKFKQHLEKFGLASLAVYYFFYREDIFGSRLYDVRKLLSFLGLTKGQKPNMERIKALKQFVPLVKKEEK